MTSETSSTSFTSAGMELRGPRSSRPRTSRHLLKASLLVIVSIGVVGLAIVASTFMVHVVSATLFGGSNSDRMESGVSKTSQQSLRLQSDLVGRRRGAVVAYAAELARFKIASSRLPGDRGINLDAAEARRRDAILTGLVLECINAVDGYNIVAQPVSVTQLRAEGLPERFVWPVDCALEQ